MVERDFKKPALNELLYIARELIKYLKENDVVLYYYCDTIDAQRSVRNSIRSPQEFRYLLFDKIFERYGDLSLIKDDVIISENGGHFISFITNVKNKSVLTEISNEVEKMNDK